MSRYLNVLRANPDFAKLWLAQVISLMGDWFSTIVLSALVVRYSPGSEGIAISGFLLARVVPPLLISPFAGVLIDRFNRKWLLIGSNLLRAVVVLMFLFTLDNSTTLPLIYGLTVLQFALAAVFEPGQSALVPTLVEPNQLVEANTLVSATWSVMLALGAAIGGVVATFFGASVALLLDAATFLAGAVLIGVIRTYHHEPLPTHAEKSNTGLLEGMRFVRQHPGIAATLLVKLGGSVGNVDTLMTIFATQVFILGAGGQLSLSIMYSAFGLGAILGPLLLNRVNDETNARMRQLIFVGFAWCALGWLLLGVTGSLLVLCLGLLVRAMGTSANWTYSTVILQKSTPDAYLGRVFAFDMVGFYFATVVSTLVHGGLIDTLGSQAVSQVALGTTLAALVPLALWGGLMVWLNRRSTLKAQPVPVGD